MKKIYKIIDKKEVISFDIFDTLLVRPYKKPDDLFMLIEKELGIVGYYQARRDAESTFYAQKGHKKEANINDIYTVIPQYEAIKDKELELELSGLSINKEIKDVFDYAIKRNKTVIIASDMYLPYEFISKILEKNGITGYKKLYLSNHINKRKDRGDMYDYIIQDLNIDANKILHIGDNKSSDYKEAKKHGLSAYHYKKIFDRFLEEDKQFKLFAKQNKGSLFTSIITSLSSQYTNTSDDYWNAFGYRYAGPIVYAYVNYIYQIAKQEKLSKILFVARDGYIAEKVFNIINKDEIKSHYVYAPRILNYTANLDFDHKLSEQPRIVCEYFNKETGKLSPSEFFKQNIDEFKKLAQKEKEKTGYVKYIQDVCGSNSRVGVVDTISGQLSAQKLIEKESGKKTTGFYISTIAGRDILQQMEHYDFFEGNLRDTFLQGNKPDLIEFIFSAPEHPIITMKDGKPVYQKKISENEKTRHEIYYRIEKGILKFVNDITQRLNSTTVRANQNEIFTLINSYVDNPSSQDIKAMFDVKKSPFADNSKYVPLFSAPNPFWKIKQNKKLIWLTPMQRLALCVLSPIKIKLRGLKYIRIHILPKVKKKILSISILGKYEISIGDSNA